MGLDTSEFEEEIPTNTLIKFSYEYIKRKKLLATNSQPLEKQWLTEKKKTILVQKVFINYLQINSVISKENYEQESCSLFH